MQNELEQAESLGIVLEKLVVVKPLVRNHQNWVAIHELVQQVQVKRVPRLQQLSARNLNVVLRECLWKCGKLLLNLGLRLLR